MTHRRLLLPSLALGLAFAPDAKASGIIDAIGLPGSTAWTAACGPDATLPPASRSDLFDCDALGFPEALCMHRVDIPTGIGEFPLATCNDGSDATFYIREGVGDYADRWVIHLEGGAGCRDYGSCLDRWCGNDGFYTAEKMSSDWDDDGTPNLPDHALIQGISTVLPENDFSAWTHVYVPYCTSDAWMGQASDVTFASGTDNFDLDTRGHSIVQAVRRMLRQKAPGVGWTAADGYTVPDIDDAAEILFTGTSAGGIGAIQNADWFLEIFDQATTGLVVDAALDPLDTVLNDYDVWIDLDGDGVGDSEFTDHVRTTVLADWGPGGLYDEIDAFVDESCRAANEPLGRMDRCTRTSKLLKLNSGGAPLIATPTFVRQDLEDDTLSRNFTSPPGGVTVLFGGSSGTALTLEDYAVLMRETLVRLYDDHDSVSGVYGPRCGKHVGLTRLLALGVDATPDTDQAYAPPLITTTATTFHDALVGWFGPSGTFVDTRLLDSDTGSPNSSCN